MSDVEDSWVTWEPERIRPRVDEPLVIIGRGRQIRLTPAAVNMLGDPSHIIFEFDRIGRRVALRRSPPDVRHAFQMKRYGDATLSTLAAESFLKWSGVDFSERREYRPEPISGDAIMVRLEPASDGVGNFEPFILKGPLLAHQAPNVSIARSGHITMNRAAKDRIQSAERVNFMFNAARRLIGFKPSTDPKVSRPLRQNKGQTTWSLAGEGFLKSYAIEHPRGRSYEPYLDGDILVIDLNKPKPERRRGGTRGERDE